MPQRKSSDVGNQPEPQENMGHGPVGVFTLFLLAGLLILSACVGTPGTATDTTNAEEAIQLYRLLYKILNV